MKLIPIKVSSPPITCLDLPLQFEAEALEVKYFMADPYDHQNFSKNAFLSHLPYGSSFGFAEVDMSKLVSKWVEKDFERQIGYREKMRKKKMEREENYAGKIENFYNDKFEKEKMEAMSQNVMVNSYKENPQVFKHIFYSGGNEEEEEEEGKDEEEQ
mmetsp:Transcript_742/g.800  ORF Transcript_742/g.800 Transcript_742/m.800 type:complete len:157 (+) Transcript_742:182-652(+)